MTWTGLSADAVNTSLILSLPLLIPLIAHLHPGRRSHPCAWLHMAHKQNNLEIPQSPGKS
jgi:hypothetical protein